MGGWMDAVKETRTMNLRRACSGVGMKPGSISIALAVLYPYILSLSGSGLLLAKMGAVPRNPY